MPLPRDNEQGATDMTRIIALALAIFAGGIASASDDDGKLDMAKADQI